MKISRRTVIGVLALLAAWGWLEMRAPSPLALSKARMENLGENYALVIGINGYSQWPALDSPVKDAETMADLLATQYNFNKSRITLLTDKTQDKPTLVNILAALDGYATQLKEDDNLLVFFSGQSAEDEDGETYWIPIDGKKTTKLTWLKHADLVESYFAADSFQAKNLCVITDSMFSNKLIRSQPTSLSPFDLRYPEKVTERAAMRSREVIAFGDQHWPGDKNTNGLGLFTYYITKALESNELEVIDFENLIFEEETIFSISKIAGTRMVRGRMRTEMDDRGQYVIAKSAPLPVADVVSVAVAPEKGYPGDPFTFSAKTNEPAYEVYVEVGERRYPMKGRGTEWELAAPFEDLGAFPYRVVAVNENEVSGKVQTGRFEVIRKKADVANVAQASVEPREGTQGDVFRFDATTDTPASQVTLAIAGKQVPMTGSGTRWSLSHPVEKAGTVDYRITAVNEDGVTGSVQKGTLSVSAAQVSVAALQTSPETGYAGEEFEIVVNTDRPARSVQLEMDGKTYPMEGSNKSWRFKRTIDDIGTKAFTVAALNVDGEQGPTRSGSIVTKKSPLPVPNVASTAVQPVAPGKGFAGDRFAIEAKTTVASDKVFVEIGDRRFPMEGSGTEWRYVTTVEEVGQVPYRVLAVNKDGAQGQTAEGAITARKPPAPKVNVASVSVQPEAGFIAKPFTFNVTTDRPAARVTVNIGKSRFPMTGSGTKWSLSQTVDQAGKINFIAVAYNEDGAVGKPEASALTVYEQKYQTNPDGTVTNLLTGKVSDRFVDNGDGTVTDLLTSLMWLQSPKQIAENYDNAVDYCRGLKVADYSGWRLPTIAELGQVIDPGRQNPSLPEGHPFTNVITHVGYWSKTRHKFGPQYVYQMSLWYGKANHQKKSENAIVWPVRYAELPEG